jgi:lysophospholipase L1-like esterase
MKSRWTLWLTCLLVVGILGATVQTIAQENQQQTAVKKEKQEKQAKTAKAKPKIQPCLVPIADDPALPRVLLIGDSISMGYTLPVRKALSGKANVHRVMENGGPTSKSLEKIDSWLGDKHWDVIHFNWGLHDLKVEGDKNQVPIDQYEKNLRTLVERLKKTDAKLIWCSTTPVPEGVTSPIRHNDSVMAYNEVAKKVMDENNIPINDLYTFALPKLKDIQLPKNVHYTDKGYEVLAEPVAAVIEKALPPKAAK